MKIIFICGCIEPGKDGVGDYTRRLAGELFKRGSIVRLLALKDPFIKEYQEEHQSQGDILIPVLRFGRNKTRNNITLKAKDWIDQLNPDWISLQFVPFSFNQKGLPFSLAKHLAFLGNGRKWHIMFHELWVGMDKNDSYKLKILGRMQKYIVKKTIDILDPEIINTHTRLYQAQLNKIGYKSEILPLFGNIPNLFQSEETKNGLINIAVFGGIHQGAKLLEWIKELPKTSIYKFHFIGSNGPEQEKWIATITKNNFEYQIHGWLRVEEISKILSKCQWGLTSTPYYLNEKSGSTAAMLEHNLIVFCIARKWTPSDIKVELLTNDAIIKWKNNLDIESFISNKRDNSENNLEVIAENFINMLKTNQD